MMEMRKKYCAKYFTKLCILTSCLLYLFINSCSDNNYNSLVKKYLTTFDYSLLSKEYRNSISLVNYNEYFKPTLTQEESEKIAMEISNELYNIYKFLNDKIIYRYEIIETNNKIITIDTYSTRPLALKDFGFLYMFYNIRELSYVTLSDFHKEMVDNVLAKYSGILNTNGILDFEQEQKVQVLISTRERKIHIDPFIHKNIIYVLKNESKYSELRSFIDSMPRVSDYHSSLTNSFLPQRISFNDIDINDLSSSFNVLKNDYIIFLDNFVQSLDAEISKKNELKESLIRRSGISVAENNLFLINQYINIFNNIVNSFEFRNLRVGEAIDYSRNRRVAVIGEYQYRNSIILRSVSIEVYFLDNNRNIIGKQLLSEINNNQIFNGRIESFARFIDDVTMSRQATFLDFKVIRVSVENSSDIPNWY